MSYTDKFHKSNNSVNQIRWWSSSMLFFFPILDLELELCVCVWVCLHRLCVTLTSSDTRPPGFMDLVLRRSNECSWALSLLRLRRPARRSWELTGLRSCGDFLGKWDVAPQGDHTHTHICTHGCVFSCKSSYEWNINCSLHHCSVICKNIQSDMWYYIMSMMHQTIFASRSFFLYEKTTKIFISPKSLLRKTVHHVVFCLSPGGDVDQHHLQPRLGGISVG